MFEKALWKCKQNEKYVSIEQTLSKAHSRVSSTYTYVNLEEYKRKSIFVVYLLSILESFICKLKIKLNEMALWSWSDVHENDLKVLLWKKADGNCKQLYLRHLLKCKILGGWQ